MSVADPIEAQRSLLPAVRPRTGRSGIRLWLPRALPAVLLLALCVPALWPMLPLAAWASHDVLHHIFRIASFDAGIRGGTLFPRWADALGFGYGFPVTHYYAPLAYGAAELFHVAGAGILDAIKLTYALGFVLSAFGMYAWARSTLGRPAALAAAAAYVYYPYHIADMYMRGTLTEFMALALLPFIMLETRRLVRGPGGPAAAAVRLALWLAALILTHNLTAFLFLPVVVFYAAALAIASPGARMRALGVALGRTVLAVALAFCLTAFYWLPALSEVGWIRAGQISSSVDELASLLTLLPALLSGALLYPYVPDAPAGIQHPLGLVIALASLLAIAAVLAARRRLSGEQRRETVIWIVIALGAIFALTELSAPLWAAIRPLAFVQYPYRLHAILGLALAMLAGLGAEALARLPVARTTLPAARRATWLLPALAGGAFTLSMIVSSLGGLHLAPQSLPGHSEPLVESEVNARGMSEYDYQTALWARLYGGPWLLEYLPAWVTEAREEFFLPSTAPVSAAPVPPAPHLVVQDDRPERHTVQAQSDAPFRLSFHAFYFPAWQVRVDDVPVPTFPSGPLALVSADVPAGEHRVSLAFEGTPFQHAGEWLSALTAALGVWAFAWRNRQLRVLLSTALLVLAGILGWRALPAGAAVTPQPVTATFDGRIDLAGYALASGGAAPGDTLDITLFWFARQALAENYKVFIHVDGPNGRAGQVDAQPGFNFSPTTRWQPGELIADHYRLTLSASAAPGDYDLYAGMYRQQPLQNLPVAAAGATPDNRVRLGKLVIHR